MRTYGVLGAAAFQLVGAVLGMTLLGWWLDGRFDMSPLWTVVCAVGGAVGGFWNLWRILQWHERRSQKDQ
jgi:F0F1-type ATP synthase assembly protein I